MCYRSSRKRRFETTFGPRVTQSPKTNLGLAEQTLRAKKSKSIDVRFDWMQGRVRQKQFKVVFDSGFLNRSDFFTKALPVHVHQEMAPLHASPPTPAALASCPVLFSLAPIVSDAGATHLLLRQSSLPFPRHLFRPKALPSLTFSLPDGGGAHGRPPRSALFVTFLPSHGASRGL